MAHVTQYVVRDTYNKAQLIWMYLRYQDSKLPEGSQTPFGTYPHQRKIHRYYTVDLQEPIRNMA
jgi:hypothetical protein